MDYYCIIYKPFNVLSQFTAVDDKQTLKDYFDVPPGVYPVGRLDYDSEGLLILTNDKKINHKLLDPARGHGREYWVQVENQITDAALRKLQEGVTITIDGTPYHTRKCSVHLFKTAPVVPARIPPIRFRKSIPDSWIKMVLTEGKNRQVRKMTAAVGFPTLRLIRYSIEKCTIEGLDPGEMRIIPRNEMYQLLFADQK